jgi:hypothetical protein
MKCLEELVAKFSNAVRGQDDALRAHDHERGNRLAKEYVQAFEELRRYGNEGRDALAVLLLSEEPSVRVMAASFLLRHKEKEARAVLEEAVREGGMAGFEASQALARWSEGEWNLDPWSVGLS